MARKKTIMKSQILDTAYAVVKAEGFEGFTARNIAKTMDCSTQPIYLEFKNMDDLKNELFIKVKDYLAETIYPKKRTGDAILDTCLNFVYFAKEETVFFKALFLEDHLGSERLHKISFEAMLKAFEQNNETKNLTKAEKRERFEEIWIVVYGTAALIAQGLLKFDEKTVTENLKNTIANTI